MADFLLTVGVDVQPSYKQMAGQIRQLTNALNANPPKIKVEFDSNSLATMQKQIENLYKAAGGQSLSHSTAEINRQTAAFQQNTSARQQNVNAARAQSKVSESNARNAEKEAQAIAKAIKYQTQINTNAAKWTAAEKGTTSQAHGQYSALSTEIDTYITSLRNGKISLKEFNTAMAGVHERGDTYVQTMRNAGETTKTLGQRLGGLASKFTTWFGLTRIIMAAYRAIRQMVTNVKELDTAMTELKKVTDETDATYNRFLEKASDRAKKLGSTMTDVVSASADFARLGYGLSDAEQLADAAIVYKNVGDGIEDINTASESIIATMQAFGIEASDAMSIVDKFNAIGNNYAISSGGVGDALLRSAAAMQSANNTLDETIALAAAANTIVQDPEKVGTTLKTVSMYLRAAKTEAEEAGESTEGMANSVSELRDDLLALTGQKVDIMADDNSFKSTYQILKELSVVWHDLSDVSQANILEMVGGKRNSNVVAAILNNFTVANDALETSADSADSALEENAKVLESIEGKISIFKATFEEMSNNLIGSDLIKLIVDIGTGLLSFVNDVLEVCDALGGLKTVLVGVSAILLTFRAEWVATTATMIGTTIWSIITKGFQLIIGIIPTVISKIKNLVFAWNMYQTTAIGTAEATAAASTVMQASIPVIGLVLAAITALVAGLSLYNNKQDELAEKTKERASAWRDEQDYIDDTIKKYRELQKSIESNTLTRAELQSVNEQLSTLQDDLIDKYGEEAEKIDLVNGKYDEEIAKLREIIGLKAVESEADLLDTKDDAEDTLRDKGAYISIDAGMVQMPDEYDDIKSAVSKAGLSHYLDDSDGTLGFDFFLTPDMDTSEVMQVYNDMVKLRDMLAQSYKDEIAEGGSLEDFYNNLTKKVNDMKTAVSEYQQALDNYNMNIAVGIFNNAMNADGTKKADEYGLVNGSLIKTQEEFDAYLKSIRESETMSDGLKEALVNIANTAFPDFAYSATNAGNAVAEATTQISTSTEKLKNASDGISSLAKAYQELADEDTGYISTDTLASIHEAVGDSIDNWSDYQDKLLSAKLGSEEFNNVLKDLTYSILENQFTLDGLATATEEEVAAVLRENGVLNANTIASEAVTIAKTKQRIQTQLTADASSSAIAALLAESDSCGIAENAYISLIAQEIIFNQNGLDVSQKLAALQALAQQAGITSATLASILDSPLGKDSATQKAWAEKHGFTVSTKKNADGSIKYTTHTDADGTKRKVEDWIWTKDGVTYENANEAALSLAGSYFSEIPTVSTPSIPNYSGAAKSSGSKQETEEQFDWIERKLKAIQRVVSNIGKTVSATYKTWTTRNTALKDQMSAINSEIATQQNAMNAYMSAANSIGLDPYYVNLIKNGGLNISTITDEDLIDQINEYQDLYDKVTECQDAIIDLQAELASLAKQSFDNISQEYNDKLALMEHMTNTFNTGIEKIEAQGYLASTKYYSAMRDVENENIKVQKQELQQLVTAMSAAMNAGLIEKGSEDWYAMQQEINAVKEAIQQSELAVIEFGNSIREVEWGHFDYLQEQISNVTAEADFLIKLMENSDLYTDNGQLTDTGKATMGLHGQNYNVYMRQADEYAKEILAINELLAEDPNNTTLLERREELLELQRDSILSAEDEKQAIIDMVEEGISLELEALNELIDAYKDSLDSAKDLYDYQKKIKEQTSEIATLQKQLSAYRNDMSEENRAVVQKIEVNLAKAMETLEETQYERYISDTTKLLDNLYLEYETMLNSRLDDAETLMNDMITEINQSATDIATTLDTEATEVGYTLSESMKSIWMPEGQAYTVITSYGEKFNTTLTTVNSTLTAISTNVAKMIKDSDKEADTTIDDTQPETGADPSVQPIVTQPTQTPTVQPSQLEKSITVGGKINAGSARIYSTSSGGGGGTQYYKNDPIYTVLGEKNGYLKVRYHKLSSGVSGWFKKSDVKAYKTGGLVDYTGLAWVDGEKDKPESFLDSEDTANVMSLRDVLRDIADGHISLDSIFTGGKLDISETLGRTNVPDDIHSATFGDIHYEINIPIDHVDDYNDLMNKMRTDDKFERLVQSMTVDRLVGRSKLEKNKFKW